MSLTPRESEIVALVKAGMVNKAIARKLEISPNTVHARLNSVYRKLGIRGREDILLNEISELRWQVVQLKQALGEGEVRAA